MLANQRGEKYGNTYSSAVLGDGALSVEDVVDAAPHPRLTQLRVDHGTAFQGHRRGDVLFPQLLSLQGPRDREGIRGT